MQCDYTKNMHEVQNDLFHLKNSHTWRCLRFTLQISWRRVHPPNMEKEVTGVNIQTAIAKVTEGVIQQGSGCHPAVGAF